MGRRATNGSVAACAASVAATPEPNAAIVPSGSRATAMTRQNVAKPISPATIPWRRSPAAGAAVARRG